MTVISTKSITGVTSITSPQSDDAVTLHTNDTTQRVSVTTGGMNVTGVVTATSFSGDVIGNITGAITATTGSFSGLVDVNNRLDVVGGANIDQANITGILTATTLTGALSTTDACQTGDLTILNGNPDLKLQDSNHAGNNTEHMIAFKDSSGNNQMNIGSPFGDNT